MIELGGNIKLEGFDNIEQSKLVVIKKIVGNFIKKLEAENKVAIILKLSEENSEFKIDAELNLNEQNKISRDGLSDRTCCTDKYAFITCSGTIPNKSRQRKSIKKETERMFRR